MHKKLIKMYADFVSYHPFIVLALMLVASYFAFSLASEIEMETAGYEDLLPEDIEVISAMNYVREEYGGADSVLIVLESSPRNTNSNEIRDVRDPRLLEYMSLLQERAVLVDNVVSASSASDILKSLNNGHIPKSLNTAKNLSLQTSRLESYISSDYSIALIRLRVTDITDTKEIEELEKELNNVINEVSRPPGISVKLSGEKIQMSVMMRLIQPDMQKTSRISLIAILVILFFLFRSIKHGIIPLMTIIFGVLWSMGFMGFIGMNLSSMTSGVIAMIMGIGIDFGIQTVTRFRQEIAHNVPKRAMSITLSNVFMPMATTTLAALIGFRAMSLGELTIMADLGTIMSYGVAACFLAAVTVIPALLVIFEFGNNKNIKYGVD